MIKVKITEIFGNVVTPCMKTRSFQRIHNIHRWFTAEDDTEQRSALRPRGSCRTQRSFLATTEYYKWLCQNMPIKIRKCAKPLSKLANGDGDNTLSNNFPLNLFILIDVGCVSFR